MPASVDARNFTTSSGLNGAFGPTMAAIAASAGTALADQVHLDDLVAEHVSRDLNSPSPALRGSSSVVGGSPWPMIMAIFGRFPSRRRIRAVVTASSPLKSTRTAGVSSSKRRSREIVEQVVVADHDVVGVDPSPYSIKRPPPWVMPMSG